MPIKFPFRTIHLVVLIGVVFLFLFIRSCVQVNKQKKELEELNIQVDLLENRPPQIDTLYFEINREEQEIEKLREPITKREYDSIRQILIDESN